MVKTIEYVRCKYCDTDGDIKQLKNFNDLVFKELPKLKLVRHKRARWDCPACSNKNISFIFKEEID